MHTISSLIRVQIHSSLHINLNNYLLTSTQENVIINKNSKHISKNREIQNLHLFKN